MRISDWSSDVCSSDLLARARHVLRRKHDGRYLAADLPDGLLRRGAHLRREPGIDDALRALAIEPARARPGIDVVPTLPLHRLQARRGDRKSTGRNASHESEARKQPCAVN